MDTSGQERFDAINYSYYKDADCCLLVYDITQRKSFEKIKEYYIPKLKDYCKVIIKVALLGNKTDLKDQRQITHEEGLALSQEKGFIFMESSCKDNYNVSDAFATLIEMTNKDMIKGQKFQNFKIQGKRNQINEQKKNKCC